ncbi:MAG: DUF4838 domain-containing protein, partial [Lentisphaeria bacterium]|nr:DUF4838 domain-containing protein [Lentisphaeria bacterium]
NASFRDVSTRFFNAVNPIAKMVWEKYPQADLRTWAYSAYRRIPYKTRLDPRLKVQFATHGRCWGHELDDPNCPINAQLYKQMLEWRRYFPGKMYTYEYFFCSNALYTCAEMTLANTLKLYKKMGYTGWKEQGYFEDNIQYRPHFSADRPHLYPSNWQLVYLAAKLLWDPDQDPVKLLEEAESLYYGKAYEVMKKYHALRRELWKSAKSCMGYPIANPRAGFLLNRQGAKEQLLAYLAEAGKLAEGDKVLQYRIGRDKYWLENYWIKPNELLHSDSGKHLFAPMANSKITVDGSGEEKAWQEAFYIDNFCWIFGKRKGTAVPKELKTTVGILADKENLYFLITAMEPSPEKMASTEGRDSAVWAKDCIEIFLYPPSVENTYYQLAIGPTGTVFDAIQPGTRQSFDLDVEVRTKILKDRYVIEARIPAAKLFPLKAGDVWRVHVSRGRSVSDGFCKGETLECFSSLSGIPQKSFTRFRSMDIGMKNPEEFVNGDFNKVRKMNDTQKRIYKGLNRTYVNGVWAPPWLLNDKGAMELRLHPDSRDDYFVKLDGTLYQIHYGRARDYTVTFRAKGNGKLAAKYFRYHYLPETKGKLKYISTGAGIPSMVLAPEWKEYRYEVHKEFDDEIFAPVFTRLSGEVFIDDVKVTEGPRLLYHNEIKTKT